VMSQAGNAFISRIRRPILLDGLLALTVVLFIATFSFFAWSVYQGLINRDIKALEANNDIGVSIDANPALIAARIEFLLRHDRVDEVQPYVESLDKRGSIKTRAAAHYNLANARLRQAFDLLSQAKLDSAGSFVILARQEYRKALTLQPDYWDAKFNLDVASRLIRDFPAFERTSGDTLNIERSKIWTDVPGKPEGLP